jgi:NAD(P)-dependent dehydrogenase (short-subunit alcohol dehydrogenase family)
MAATYAMRQTCRGPAPLSPSAFGPPDLVIANAGVSRGTLTEYAEDLPAFAAVFETNVLGIVHTFQPFLAAMRARGSGTLVGIASVAGFRGLPGSGAYSASKAAAISYLESLRVEEQKGGIKVVHAVSGLHRDAVDGQEPLQDAVPDATRRRGDAHATCDRHRQQVRGCSVANGDRRARAALSCRACSTIAPLPM